MEDDGESEEDDNVEETEEIEDEDLENNRKKGRDLIDSNLSTSIVAYMEENDTDI